MKQMTLDLMTAEEARKRIFSMKVPAHKEWQDPDKIVSRQMREIVNSSLDLRHIDETSPHPTRQEYQWMMDLVLWTRILHSDETDEGYPFTAPRPSSCYLAKLEALSKKCRPDRYLRADGCEQWPLASADKKMPEGTANWTILDALMGQEMIHCATFGYVSDQVINILDNLLPDASVPVEDATRAMTTLLSHYGYHSGYSEVIQVNYGMKDLARLMKRACPELTAALIVIPDDPNTPTKHSDLWDRPVFAEIKSILDNPLELQSSPSRKCTP